MRKNQKNPKKKETFKNEKNVDVWGKKKKKPTCTGGTTWTTVKRRMEGEEHDEQWRSVAAVGGEGEEVELGQRSDNDKRVECYTEKM